MQAIISKNKQRACQLGRQALRVENMCHNARFLSFHYAKINQQQTGSNQNKNSNFFYKALGFGLIAGGYMYNDRVASAEEAEKPAEEKTTESKVAEPTPAPTTEDEEDIMGNGSVMKEITKENLVEIMKLNENKFIYHYRKSTQNPEERDKVEEFAQKI